MSRFTKLAAGTLFLCAVSGTASSAPNIVVNGDFQANSNNTTPISWTAFGPGITGPNVTTVRVRPVSPIAPSPFTAIDGNYALFRGIGTNSSSADATGIYQDLTIPALDIGTATYTISFRLIGPNNTPNYFLATVANNPGVAGSIGTPYSIPALPNFSSAQVQSPLSWVTYSATFTPQNASVRIAFQGATSLGSGWGLDSVSVTKNDAVVPEIDAASGAGALALLVGVLGLVGERRRRA